LTKRVSRGIVEKMENNAPQQAPEEKSKMLPIGIAVAVIVIIVIGAIAMSMGSSNSEPVQTNQEQAAPTQSAPAANEMTESEMAAHEYQDGEFSAEGMYTSPGGEESIDVTLTLQGDVIEDATVVSNATRPISVKMQTAFIEGFKDQVIGKKISEVSLTKVSGSSLTPKGFNDAIEKIKTEAKSS